MGAQGTTTVDFGAFPGSADASVAVAQAGIGAGSLAEAWIWPVATADHTADEHLVEPLKVFAHSIVAGVGFSITVLSDNRLMSPVTPPPGANSTFQLAATTINNKNAQPGKTGAIGTGEIPRVYGVWTVAWAWN